MHNGPEMYQRGDDRMAAASSASDNSVVDDPQGLPLIGHVSLQRGSHGWQQVHHLVQQTVELEGGKLGAPSAL